MWTTLLLLVATGVSGVYYNQDGQYQYYSNGDSGTYDYGTYYGSMPSSYYNPASSMTPAEQLKQYTQYVQASLSNGKDQALQFINSTFVVLKQAINQMKSQAKVQGQMTDHLRESLVKGIDSLTSEVKDFWKALKSGKYFGGNQNTKKTTTPSAPTTPAPRTTPSVLNTTTPRNASTVGKNTMVATTKLNSKLPAARQNGHNH